MLIASLSHINFLVSQLDMDEDASNTIIIKISVIAFSSQESHTHNTHSGYAKLQIIEMNQLTLRNRLGSNEQLQDLIDDLVDGRHAT